MASPSNRGFVYTENLLFSVATHISDLGWLFWVTCCSFYISGCSFTFALWCARDSFFPLTLGSNPCQLHTVQLPPLSVLTELKRLGSCSALGFGLWKHCGWWDLPSRPTPTFTPSAISLFTFLSLCIHWRSTSHFLEELFLCIHKPANWCRRPSFWPVFTFEVPSSLSFVISRLGFKVRYAALLSPQHCKATARWLVGLISVLLFPGCREAQEEGGSHGTFGLWNRQSVYLSLKFIILYWWGSWCPKIIRVVISEITD